MAGSRLRRRARPRTSFVLQPHDSRRRRRIDPTPPVSAGEQRQVGWAVPVDGGRRAAVGLRPPPSPTRTEGTTMPNDNETTYSAETKQVPPDRSRLRTRGHVEDFGQGRVCATAGCEIVLSRYN